MKRIIKEFKIIRKAVNDFFEFIVWLFKREIAYYKIKPREALFFLTYRCSSRCKTCKMWKRPHDYEEMDLSSWKKTVDMLAELKVKIIYLFGGDVILKKEILIPLANYIASKGICCDITTNGNLLNKETAKQLIDAGVHNIGVSIDSIGEHHDSIRGVKGIFERATQGIKDLLEARGNSKEPSINIYCTVSKLNIDTFDKVYQHAVDLGVDSLHIEYYGEFSPEDSRNSEVAGIYPNPYYERQDGSLLLETEQAYYLKNKIYEIEKNNDSKIILDTNKIACLSIDDLVNGKFQHKRCYTARYEIHVDPSGNIIPCFFFQNYHLGNIQDTPVSKIWGNKKHRIFLNSIKRKGVKICKTCIEGVQRNPTLIQALRRKFSDMAKSFKKEYLRKHDKNRSN